MSKFEREEITNEEIDKALEYISKKSNLKEFGSISFMKAYDDPNMIIVKVYGKSDDIYKIYEIKKENL